MNQTFELQKPEASPFDNEQLTGYLQRMREMEPDTYLAFWLSVGTELTQSELASLQWEHFTNSKRGLIIRGFLGSAESVETHIADQAASAIASFRRQDGPVLSGRVWPQTLRMLIRFTGAPDVSAFRAFLEVPPCRRAKGRLTPVQSLPEPSPAQALEQPQVITRTVAVKTPQTPTKSAMRCVPVEEAAERVSMSVRWIKERVKACELKGYRLGHKIMIDAQSLNEFLSARSIGQEVA